MNRKWVREGGMLRRGGKESEKIIKNNVKIYSHIVIILNLFLLYIWSDLNLSEKRKIVFIETDNFILDQKKERK